MFPLMLFSASLSCLFHGLFMVFLFNLFNLFKRLSPDFSFEQTKSDKDPSKEGTGRRALRDALRPSVRCYTLEVSFYASTGHGANKIKPYTQQSYMDLGRNVGLTFAEYYGVTKRRGAGSGGASGGGEAGRGGGEAARGALPTKILPRFEGNVITYFSLYSVYVQV